MASLKAAKDPRGHSDEPDTRKRHHNGKDAPQRGDWVDVAISSACCRLAKSKAYRAAEGLSAVISMISGSRPSALLQNRAAATTEIPGSSRCHTPSRPPGCISPQLRASGGAE